METTSGIFLKQIKYQDNVRILTIFTRKFGKLSFMLYFGNSKKSLAKIKILQPLYLLNITFKYRTNFNIHRIHEIALQKPYTTIPYSVKKTAIAFLLAEILDKVIFEHYVDEKLYSFLVNSFEFFDLNDKGTQYFHLLFLVKLTKFLGFYPENNFSSSYPFFNYKEGKFMADYSVFSYNKADSELFNKLLSSDFSDLASFSCSITERRNLLDSILKFYSYHIENFMPLKSLYVLKRVFE